MGETIFRNMRIMRVSHRNQGFETSESCRPRVYGGGWREAESGSRVLQDWNRVYVAELGMVLIPAFRTRCQ